MTRRDERERMSPEEAAATFALLVAAFVSLPALLLALAAVPRAKRWRLPLSAAALVGVGVTVALWPTISAEVRGAVEAMQAAGGLIRDPGRAAEAAWPHVRSWWLFGLGLAPAFALAIDLLRPKSVDEVRERDQRRDDRRSARAESRARRKVGAPPLARREDGVSIGRYVSGDRLLTISRGRVELPLSRLARTILAIGTSGSGKTEFLLRLAYGVASQTDWAVVVIDPKGDPQTQERFADAMRQAQREPRVFPQQSYDGFRGGARELVNRLVQLIDWAEEGGGTYYRDLSVNLVRLACTAPGGPPRSSAELLERIDKNKLTALWVGSGREREIAAFRAEHVDACRQRYRSFFDAVDGRLDGDFAFEDASASYLLLNELAYGEETGKLARFLIEDFKQYVAARKRRDERVLLIVDEFSAIADGERMARVVEVVRSYGATVVLAPQAYEGMGGEDAAARILNAAHTTFLFQVPNPEQIVRTAGTRLAIEQSIQHEAGIALDLGSAREQHQHKVSPNDVRALPPGMCFAIGSGKAQKIQIAPLPCVERAPTSRGLDEHVRVQTETEPAPQEPLRL